MKEWTSQFNPFHSLKVLAWRDRFEAIMKGEIPAPVAVTLDSTNVCNLKCTFCHSYAFRKENQKTASKEDLLWVADILPDLGVKGCCYSGGGEPFLHPDSGIVMRRLKDNGIAVGTITNGTRIDKFMEDILYSCRWIGVSVDAANPDTYKELKGGDANEFYRVTTNLRTLARKRKDNRSPSIGFKYLFHPKSYHELHDAVRLAKSLGVDDFHARPCFGEGIMWEKQMIIDALESINVAQGMFDDENFHVYGVTHKFDETFHKKVLDKCEITPIAGLTFAADGYVYCCCDLRSEDQGRLCKWRDILDVWGSDKHKEVLKNIDPKKCPVRCTYAPYQEILEKVFREDRMTYNFP